MKQYIFWMSELSSQQDKQCMQNITLGHLHETIVNVGGHKHVLLRV
jgi:hypothetical protein